jgi:hypothetical protein
VFCPKAFAGIGKALPDTVRDRSITLWLLRKAPGESVARFIRREVTPPAEELRERVVRWADAHLGAQAVPALGK